MKTSNKIGYLIFVLHAHLPYIRYPENEYHLEENWLFEAITETYIPLLDVMNNLLNDRLEFRLTISLTPSLIEMFKDDLLMKRYVRYLDNLIELSEKEVKRTRRDIDFHTVAKMYKNRLLKTKYLFEDIYKKDITSGFAALMYSRNIEIIASAATHAYLPALLPHPAAAKTQIILGTRHYKKIFGKKPSGVWLPECGFARGIDDILKESGTRYFFLESHAHLSSSPRASNGIYVPVKTPSGVIAFARDAESSKQVWSSTSGYPGDFYYRDFYRDIGFELDYDYIKKYVPAGIRTFTGMKYYRITGRTDQKKPYNRMRAIKRASVHAEHFLKSRTQHILSIYDRLKINPVITAAYDAELLGHWWFEGPEWLDNILRKAHKYKTLSLITPSEYISENKSFETVQLPSTSWGYRGYSSTWINNSNAWIQRHLNRAAKLMTVMADKNKHARGLMKRALNQALRELLIAQASDWPFMIKTGNASMFAENKFREHIKNFFDLASQIRSGSLDAEKIVSLEKKNNIFKDIDFRVYISK